MSQFFPWLGTMPTLDAVIQLGRGVAAGVVGQTYDVRRLDDATNVSVSSNAPIFTQFPVKLERTTSKAFLENQIFELIVFEATCQNTPLVLFDQLTETGYEAEPQGTFVFAQGRPMHKTIFVRTEANITISRPVGTALTAAQQPSSGTTYIGNGAWSGVWKENDQTLVLVDGMYSFSSDAQATPAQVQCGLSPNARVSAGNTLDVPTEQVQAKFCAWLPMLPGVMLNEMDRLNFGQGDRYEIDKFFTTDETGLAGQLMLLTKLGGS